MSSRKWCCTAFCTFLLLGGAGCETTPRSNASESDNPQDRTRRTQLDRMSAEDAATADTSQPAEPRRRAPSQPQDRQRGQRVIDEPLRR